MRPRKRRTEEEQRALVVRQGELTALAQHPSWPVLEAVIEAKREEFMREIAVAIFAGLALPPERQAFIRGFLKGAQYVLVVPTNAQAALERELREQLSEEAAA